MCCKVIAPLHDEVQKYVRPLGEPSTLPNENSKIQIFDNGNEYVYRLALCISPYYTRQYFQGDKAKAREWVKEAGEYLTFISAISAFASKLFMTIG